MTAQMGEYLFYEGRKLIMCSEPLGVYLKNAGIELHPMPENSGLWRGYVGTWEIQDRRLYLIGLSGRMEGGIELSVATFFPDSPDRVFAGWFTGRLRLPQGEMLNYVHMGYGSTFERDLFISIKKGVVTKTKECLNVAGRL